MAKPAVSVCVPTYNGMNYLPECFDSILGQSFADFEIVAVDDASSDGTYAFLQEQAAHDQRVRVFQNENKLGLVRNWNRCIQLAQGEWIKFVFQDDILLPPCVDRMLSWARQRNALFVGCRRHLLFSPGTTAEMRAFYYENAAQIQNLFSSGSQVSPTEFALAVLRNLCVNFIGEPTVTLIHRGLFDRCGLFNDNLIMCCDSEFWYRIGTQVGVCQIPEILATFRIHGESASARNFSSRLFRMQMLDRVVIAYEFAYSPQYRALRKAARTHYRRYYLTRVWLSSLWDALQAMERMESTACDESRSCGYEWDTICAAYPRLRGMARRVRWYKKVRGFPRNMVAKLLPAAK